MSTPALDALAAKADARRAPVPGDVARARMRDGLGTPQRCVLDDTARFLAIRTARAAGKTATMVSDALEQMSTVGEWRGCYGALTKDAGIENLWDEIRRQDREFGFGLKYDISESTVIYPETGGRLRVRSYSTRKEVDKWRGKQYHRLYLDECQSIDDEVLTYAVIQALPHTLARFHGGMRLGGTPRLECEGWWYAVTGPPGLEPQRFADGTVRAMARPYRDRDDPVYLEIGWAWSLHNWPRAENPGLPDAVREADELRRALAARPQDRAAIAVEADGEWPERDQAARLYRFDALRNTWTAGPPERLYDLPAGHDWGFYLGADLAIKNDRFALALGACAPTSRVAYHCAEYRERGLTTSQMAEEINTFRRLLGHKLKAIVGDSQGPTGHWIFEELSRVHSIPIEKAKKSHKDDGIELVSSDLHAGRMLISAGSVLAQQLANVKRPLPNLPASKQPKQDDDVTDAWLYCRRRMTHGFGKDKPPPLTPVERQQVEHARQLRAMQAHRAKREDPWGTFRGGSRPW